MKSFRALLVSTAFMIASLGNRAANAQNLPSLSNPRTPASDPLTTAAIPVFNPGFSLKSPADSIRENILTEARRHIGVRERGGNNRGPEIRGFLQYAYNSSKKAGDWAWCAAFVSWVLNQTTPGTVRPHLLVQNIRHQFMDKMAFHQPGAYTPKPGDVIFFDRGTPTDGKEHIGFVTRVDDDGTLHTIEGNAEDPIYENNHRRRYNARHPDAVRERTYTPAQFAEKRLLGFGNIARMTGHDPLIIDIPMISTTTTQEPSFPRPITLPERLPQNEIPPL
jgi:uncharacterized protein (TIGR02594 family)